MPSRSISSAHLLTIAVLALVCIVAACILVIQFVSRPTSVSDATTTNTSLVNASSQNTINTNTQSQPVFVTTEFSIVSNEMTEGVTLPADATCDGEGRLPDIQIINVPKKAISLAVVMHDPDVPKDIRADRTWYHFAAWNISPDTLIVTDYSPLSTVRYGTTTSRTMKFVPPCPPDAEHRYVFTAYALDTMLELPAGATVPELFEAMKGHELKKTTFITTYNRHANATGN